MAWSPKFIDKPLRFIYDPEVWGLVFIIMMVMILFNMNQAVSLISAVICGAGIQKIVDNNKRGYVIHMLYYLGFLKIFCSYGKYRI